MKRSRAISPLVLRLFGVVVAFLAVFGVDVSRVGAELTKDFGPVYSDPGPPVCPDTLRPPSAPAGIPELNICHYDFATVVSDTWRAGDDRAGQRTITLAMFGQAYRLRLESRPEGCPAAEAALPRPPKPQASRCIRVRRRWSS